MFHEGSCACLISITLLIPIAALPNDAIASNDWDDRNSVVGSERDGLQICLALSNHSFGPLEPIRLDVTVLNRADSPRFIHKAPPSMDLSWEVVTEAGQSVQKLPILPAGWGRGRMGSHSIETINPKGQMKGSFVLNRLFDLSIPGRYWLQIAARTAKEAVSNGGTPSEFVRLYSGVIEFEIKADEWIGTRPRVTESRTSVFNRDLNGVTIEVSSDSKSYKLLEPIELTVTTKSNSPQSLGLVDTRPWASIRARVSKQATRREAQLTGHGKTTPICTHRLSAPLADGGTHVDRFFLNRFVDVSEPGTYEIELMIEIRGDDTSQTVSAIVGPLSIAISSEIWQGP